MKFKTRKEELTEDIIEHLKMYDVNPKQRSEITERVIEVAEKHADHIGEVTANMVFELLKEDVSESEALDRINGFTQSLAEEIYKEYMSYKE